MEGYIRTPEWFGSFRISFGVPGVTGPPPPQEVIGPHGPNGGREEAGLKGGRAPSHGLVRIGLGKGGTPFLPSPSPFPFSYSMWEVESY